MNTLNKKKLTTAIAVSAWLGATSMAVGMDHSHKKNHDTKKPNAEAYWKEFKQDAGQSWDNTQSAFRDGWVEGKLESALLVNRHLSAMDIDIAVDGNTAKLSGHVDSDTQKELAENIALGIEGIDAVDNDLKVSEKKYDKNKDKKREMASERSFSQYMEDVSTTAEIKTELLASSNTAGLAIDVDTYMNTVTLSGRVDSKAEKALAEAIASKNDDVVRVVNRLDIASSN